MDSNTKQKDNDFLYELDIDHIEQPEENKPTAIVPTTLDSIIISEPTKNDESTQNTQEINQNYQPNENTTSPQTVNIDTQSAQAATAIINNDVPAFSQQQDLPQVQASPTLVNTGLYSTDPSNVNTDIARNPQIQLNSNIVAEQNQTNGAQPYVNKPIYGGIIDPTQANDTVTNKPPIKKRPLYKNKKVLLIIAGSVFIVLLIIGLVFGLYLPNTPNNVWNTGLNRTGKQTSAVIQALSDPKVSESLKKSKIEAGGTVKDNDKTYTVSSNVAIDASKSDTTAQVKATSSESKDEFVLDVAVKTELPEAALLPNVYFKVGTSDISLFKSFGIPEKYNKTWISAEQDFMSELANSVNVKPEEAQNITKEDIISVVNDINSVSQQYVFSSDPQNAIINKKAFLGGEKIDGVKANHYKAGINKENAKKYCNAVVDKLVNNKSFSKIVLSNDSNTEAKKQEYKQSCDQSINDIPYSQEFDIWINKSIKIVQLVRFYEDLSKRAEEAQKRKTECLQSFGASNSTTCDYADGLVEKGQKYTEYGQTIKSKKELSLYTANVSDTDKNKSNIRADIYVNSDTYELNGKITAKIDNPDNKVNADLTFKMTPYNGQIDTSKPKDSVPIKQVLQESKVEF